MSKKPPMRQRMLDAAICAYSVVEGAPFNPDVHYWDPVGADMNDAIPFLSGTDDINAGFVVTTRDNWVVLSFRGTLSTHHSWHTFKAYLYDWLQDEHTRPVPMHIDGQEVGRVEQGFYSALKSIWPRVRAALRRQDLKNAKGLQITGHSKGASMTFLAAAKARIEFPHIKKIEVHAYAPALTGQADFANWYDAHGLGATTMRYQRQNDIVPFIPPGASWDIFSHLGWGENLKGDLLIEVFKLLSHLAYGGYQAVGSLTFLPDPPSSSRPVTGNRGELMARKAIVDTIQKGGVEAIMHAHSAACSYWPAIFQQRSKDPACRKKG